MKNQKLRIFLLVMILSLVFLGCAPTTPEEGQQSNLPTPTSLPPDTRFTIQADEGLQAPVRALYEAFYPGEEPEFAGTDAYLVATSSYEWDETKPEVPATFLENAVLLPQNELQDVQDFVAFAVSADGQQALITAGFLPASITLTDQAGKFVEIQQPVRRVISSYGPTTGIVYNVGADDRLVSASYLGARDTMGAVIMEKIDPRFPQIMGEDKFSQSEFNIEEAAILNPDLVLTSARSAWLETAGELDIPIYLYDA